MPNQLEEIKRNLCKVQQFDLADALGPESIPARETARFLESTRALIAVNGCRSALSARTRAEIVAWMWGYAASQDDGEYLRMRVMMAIEQLVREQPGVENLRFELWTLTKAYEASWGESHDLHDLARLVQCTNFAELGRSLSGLHPSTKSYVQVFGRAYQYSQTGDMNSIAYARVLQEVEDPEWQALL